LYFFELVQNVISSRQSAENIPETKRLLVLAEDPPEEKAIDTEAITIQLDDRESGSFGRSSTTSKSTVREAVHHFRSVQSHPEHLNEKLITMGRSFDNIVTFNIYARTNKQSISRLLWFENLMDSFRWYFSIYLFKPVEQKAWRVGNVKIGNLSLVKYSVSYLVRTEDTYQFGSQELRHVALNVNVSRDNN
jgi:hypothetical protein